MTTTRIELGCNVFEIEADGRMAVALDGAPLAEGYFKVESLDDPAWSFRMRKAPRVAPDGAPVTHFIDTLKKVILLREQHAARLLEVLDGIKAARDAEKAEVEAARVADRLAEALAAAGFAGGLPADWTRLEVAHFNGSAADGYGIETFKHGDCEFTRERLEQAGAKIVGFDRAYENRWAFLPTAALDALVGRKAAVEAAARTARGRAEAERTAEAAATGKPVELRRWAEDCDGTADECSMDLIVEMVHPDGTKTTKRTHTH